MQDLDGYLPRIVQGDARAFAQWMVHAEPTVRGRLAPFSRSVDVESVVQEALLRAWEYAPKIELRGSNSLLRFTLRAAKNLAISETRRLRTPPVEPGQMEETEAVSVSPSDPHLRDAVKACRDKLPQRPRDALTARLEAQGALHDVEVAKTVNMSKNAFLQNVTRARRFLTECLQRAGVDLSLEMSP